jgi:hypothetical protein
LAQSNVVQKEYFMSPPAEELAQICVTETRHWFRTNVRKIEHCLNQLSDEQIGWRPQESMNSIANLVLHLCGNIRQRILATIAGQPDIRDRPREFSERSPIPITELIRRLHEITEAADKVIAKLNTDGLIEPRHYQGLTQEFHGTAFSTILHSVTHLCGHTQEIVFMTRLQLGDGYQLFQPPSVPADRDDS